MHINTTGTAQNGILCYGKEKGHQKGPETHWIRTISKLKTIGSVLQRWLEYRLIRIFAELAKKGMELHERGAVLYDFFC